MADPLPLARPAARSRRKPPVTRTLLPGDRAELLNDALDDLSESRDTREDPDAAEALERMNIRLATRVVELDTAARAVADARDFDALARAIELCRRVVRR